MCKVERLLVIWWEKRPLQNEKNIIGRWSCYFFEISMYWELSHVSFSTYCMDLKQHEYDLKRLGVKNYVCPCLYICNFAWTVHKALCSAKHAALLRNSKHWLARNQENVAECRDLYTPRPLFYWASTIKIQLSVLV